ncbi:MAG: porin [Gammaproteobacteria bacterium]
MKCFPAVLSAALMLTASPIFAESANKVQKAPPFTFKFGGLLMYDAAWYQGHDALQGKTAGYTDETGFRRARLSAQGRVYGDWDYNVTLDVTNALNNVSNADPVEIWQALVSYSGFKTAKIKAGQFYEPFSLEAATSSRATTFMERGLPYTFSPVRSVGVGFSAAPAKGLYLEAGGFTEDLNSAGNLKRAFTGRVAYAPIDTKGRLLHFGAGASYRVPGDNTLRYRARPESDLAPAWFSTATIRNVDNIVLTGLEAAAVRGAVSLQAEYVRSDVSRSDGRRGRNIDGYYVYASWFLTGESRPYRDGRFGAIKPENPLGAWEVAVRNSAISDDSGEKLSDITLGLNWYINRHARLMANYVYADYEKNIAQGNADIFQVRGQVDF